MKDEILGVIKSDKLKVTSYNLVSNFKSAEEIEEHLQKVYNKNLVKINVSDDKIETLIKNLQNTPEVKELAKRKSDADNKKYKE